MIYISRVSPETHEKLIEAYNDWQAFKITNEQYNQIIESCFAAELEASILGAYPETKG